MKNAIKKLVNFFRRAVIQSLKESTQWDGVQRANFIANLNFSQILESLSMEQPTVTMRFTGPIVPVPECWMSFTLEGKVSPMFIEYENTRDWVTAAAKERRRNQLLSECADSDTEYPLKDAFGRFFKIWGLSDCQCKHCKHEMTFKQYEGECIPIMIPECDACEVSFGEQWSAFSGKRPDFLVQEIHEKGDGSFDVANRMPRMAT